MAEDTALAHWDGLTTRGDCAAILTSDRAGMGSATPYQDQTKEGEQESIIHRQRPHHLSYRGENIVRPKSVNFLTSQTAPHMRVAVTHGRGKKFWLTKY